MTPTDTASGPRGRIGAIDALRGLVMLLMVVDHVREFFYLHAQVGDPMNLAVTPPGLALTRMSSHLCAPVFILLAGLSANLYAQKNGRRAACTFLLTRGLLLIVLELTLVNLAWTRSLFPPVLYLQVIWAIGISMVALAALLWLPRPALAALALVVMLGHNGLDGVVLAPGQGGYVPWTILHQRGLIALPWGGARTSYPVLPWIGVVAAGYALGPLFAPGVGVGERRRRLLALGAASLAAFLVLRGLAGYGDPVPWQAGKTWDASALWFVNLTKYPPSACFLLLTLGAGLLLLAVLEALPQDRLGWLRVFGGAPLFFYVAHLWLLRVLHDGALGLGLASPASGRVELGSPAQIWLVTALLCLPLHAACRWMVGVKRRSRSAVLRYL
ncbi:MAG: heparan-alpha-glucosaminide N-acetyltransferase domain-containing protein [Methylobacterium frigidaeris]